MNSPVQGPREAIATTKTSLSFMRRQPDGYKQWKAVGHHNKWSHGMSKLGERLLNPTSPLPPYFHVTALEEAVDAFYRGEVPVHIVNTFDVSMRFRIDARMVFDKIRVDSAVEGQVKSRSIHDVRKQFYKFIQTQGDWTRSDASTPQQSEQARSLFLGRDQQLASTDDSNRTESTPSLGWVLTTPTNDTERGIHLMRLWFEGDLNMKWLVLDCVNLTQLFELSV